MSIETRHLSAEELAAYRRRTLAPADLLYADDHLARCAACRRRIGGGERLGGAVAAIREDLTGAGATDHPAHEQIAAFVDEALEDVERELVASHLELCPSCAEDVEDLRALRDAVHRTPPPFRSSRPTGWQTYGVVGALAAGLAGFVVWTIQPDSETAGDPAPVAVLEPPPAPPAPPADAPVTSLNDGGTTVTFSADGRANGLPSLAGEDAAAVHLALAEGNINLPPILGELGGARGTLMSGASETPGFRLVRPLATAVEADRPAFEWTALPGAATYVVAVFDLEFTKAAESPPVTATRWQPRDALPRGRTYTWQVRATRAGNAVVAPAPPAPEARFRVLSQAEAERLADVRRRHGSFHLVMGVLLAEAGALDEAEHELEQLVQANPGVDGAERLLASLRTQRGRLSPR